MSRLFKIFLLLTAFDSLSQTEIKEVQSLDIYTSKDYSLVFSKTSTETVTNYFLLFRDEQYDYIDDFKYIKFDDTTQVVNFMNLAMSSIKTLKNYQFMLGEQYIYFGDHIYQGIIIYSSGGWFSLTYKNAEDILAKLRCYSQLSIVPYFR